MECTTSQGHNHCHDMECAEDKTITTAIVREAKAKIRAIICNIPEAKAITTAMTWDVLEAKDIATAIA